MPTKKSSMIAQKVAADRRQRAILAMLKDEQCEHTDLLDERFRELRQQGHIKLEPNRSTTTKLDDGGDHYDSMYRGLQLQPTISQQTPTSVDSSNQSKTLEASKKQQLDFASALDEFLQIAAAPEGDIKSAMVGMDTILREQLHPALKKSPLASSRCVLDKLVELRQHFKESKEQRANAPTLVQISLLRLIAALYPTNVRFHAVATPAFAFAMEVVTASRISCVPQCARLVFLCSMLLSWMGDNIRYLPEVMAFLLGALQLCVRTAPDEQFPTMAFPISVPHREMLFVEQKTLESLPASECLSLSTIFGTEKGEGEEEHEIGERRKLLTIRTILHTIDDYAHKYQNQVRNAFNAVFSPFHELTKCLPIGNYPPELAQEAMRLTSSLREALESCARRTHLKRSAKKGISAIKMLEPRYEERFNPERPNRTECEQQNAAKGREKMWAQRARKERRGALKVLRRDARANAGIYADKQRKVRRERDEKTRRIMQSLEGQESEYRKLKDGKKHK